MKRWAFIAVAGFILFSESSRAETTWEWVDDTLAIGSARSRSGAILSVMNPGEGDLTLTIDLQLVNLKASRFLPVTVTCPASSTTNVVTLRSIQKEAAWNYSLQYSWMHGDWQARHDDSAVYQLPYPSGHAYEVTQGYGGTASHMDEDAIDFGLPEKTPVLAARSGKVVMAEMDHTVGGPSPEFKPYSNRILIQHADGTIGRYLHLAPRSATVQIGQAVRAGQKLALSGKTGYARGAHLHFEVYRPVSGQERQFYRVRFLTSDGVVTPEEGKTYTSVVSEQVIHPE